MKSIGICLHPKFEFIDGKESVVGLASACQQLINTIDSSEEWEASFNNLPYIAGQEIVSKGLFNRLVGVYADLKKVLSKYPTQWHEQILLVNESKLAGIINTEQKLVEILQTFEDPVLQASVIKTLKANMVYLLKSGKVLGIILGKFAQNPSVQIEIIEAIEPKLSIIIKSIKSVKKFSLILNTLEEISPELLKEIIAAYATNLTPDRFVKLLSLLSEKPVLQEKVIATLNNEELRRLCKGVKEKIFKILQYDSELCQIVEEATQVEEAVPSKINPLTRFFKRLTNQPTEPRPDADVAFYVSR